MRGSNPAGGAGVAPEAAGAAFAAARGGATRSSISRANSVEPAACASFEAARIFIASSRRSTALSRPNMAALVPERLAVLQHVLDALLGLGRLRERDEVPALEVEKPLLVHAGARIDRAPAQRV